MTPQEKREEQKARLKKELKQKVRKHRPAKKVLELAVMMLEDQIEMMDRRREACEWQIEYLRNLNPAEIEPDVELNDIKQKK